MGFLIILISIISLSKAFEVYPPVTDSNSTKQQDIYFVFMQSVTGLAFNASGTIPAIQIALDLINNDTSILNGYTLHYVLGDSQVRMKTVCGIKCHMHWRIILCIPAI